MPALCRLRTYLPLISFFIIVTGFVIYKQQHLRLPCFWDEAWSYAPAVSYMYKNGLGLLPGTIPPDMARGHPLLFYFLAATWAKLFGNTIFSLHVFSLAVSVSLLSVVYYLGSRISAIAGVAAVMLLCVQPVFLAQAGLLLPEVLLTLFVLLSLACWLNENNPGFILSATCLLLTKESGIIFLIALGVWIAAENIMLERDTGFSAKKLFSGIGLISVPFIFASLYFIIQKVQYGWFFYPEHVAFIKLDWHSFKQNYWECHKYLFEDHSRKPLTVGFLIITISFWKELKFSERLLISFGILAVTKIFAERWPLPENLELIALPMLLAMLYHKFFFRMYGADKWKGRFIGISALFAILFLSFSAVNFLSIRYLLCTFPLFLLTALIFTREAILSRIVNPRQSGFLLLLLAAACSVNILRNINKPNDVRDDNLNFAGGIKVQQDIVRFFKDNHLNDRLIYGTFLNEVNLTKPEAGYISEQDTFLVDGLIHDNTEYFIFTNIEESPFYNVRKKANVELIKRIEHGKARAEIYRKNNADEARTVKQD
ncbi:MAG TPA: glycosyltransferase family 39 protein [Chitinophagales bacterium]|nr:glycosyltransferase family 39 protein [Chitinophagales bacterium]